MNVAQDETKTLFADLIVFGSDFPGSQKIIVDVCPDIRVELDLD